MLRELEKADSMIQPTMLELLSPRSEDKVVDYNPRNENFQALERKFLDKDRGIREILDDIEQIEEDAKGTEDLARTAEILQEAFGDARFTHH